MGAAKNFYVVHNYTPFKHLKIFCSNCKLSQVSISIKVTNVVQFLAITRIHLYFYGVPMLTAIDNFFIQVHNDDRAKYGCGILLHLDDKKFNSCAQNWSPNFTKKVEIVT